MTQPPESPYGQPDPQQPYAQPYPAQPDPQQPYGQPYPSQQPPQYPAAPAADPSAYGQPQYGQPQPQYGQAPPYGAYGMPPGPGGPAPSRAMAISAFVLAILGFFYITALISGILAIIVLVRARSGRAGGRGLAIAALVIDALWFALLILIIVVAIVAPSSSHKSAVRGSDGRVTKEQTVSVLALKEGDCLDDPALFSAATSGGETDSTVDTTSVKVVPCTTSHQLEYYATVDVSDLGDTYPGESVLTDRASSGCGSAFTSFVGVPAGKSVYGFTDYFPQSGVWPLKSQRKISCLVGDPKGNTTGSLAGIGK